jgi:uncharacterized protein (TIGR00369 family)
VSSQDQAIIETLNGRRPACIKTLGGKTVAIDREARSCTMEFELGTEFCHSEDVVQGGFITAMLDAAMSHAVFCNNPDIVAVATLEIKVSFFEPSRAGRFSAHGVIRKMGWGTGFMEAELYDENGLLTAIATTTAKLGRQKVAG